MGVLAHITPFAGNCHAIGSGLRPLLCPGLHLERAQGLLLLLLGWGSGYQAWGRRRCGERILLRLWLWLLRLPLLLPSSCGEWLLWHIIIASIHWLVVVRHLLLDLPALPPLLLPLPQEPLIPETLLLLLLKILQNLEPLLKKSQLLLLLQLPMGTAYQDACHTVAAPNLHCRVACMCQGWRACPCTVHITTQCVGFIPMGCRGARVKRQAPCHQ